MKEDKAFWPETKFFYEEYILTQRCLKHGYTTVYEPGLQVLHESGAATRYSYRNERAIRISIALSDGTDGGSV